MSIMPSRTKGAWIIGHSLKLQQVNVQGQFTNIDVAGKFGRLLSALSAEKEEEIPKGTVATVAKSLDITPGLELPQLLLKMEEDHLISRSKSGNIAVLGMTHGATLERTARYFERLNPEEDERVAIAIAERVSDSPVRSIEMAEYVSDTFKLKRQQTRDTLALIEDVGFIDAEVLDAASKDKLYFNGNIFRGKDPVKTHKVLESLSSEEQRKNNEFQQGIAKTGYATIDDAKRILDAKLFEKLQAIALFDVNRVANDSDEMIYVTRPGSFAKYGNPWEEDTLDYAKALVSSLAYGMTRSSASRGRITMLRALLGKLNRGEWLNENTAAGQDYRYLEVKRVVQTKEGFRPGCFNMRLLKKEVGVIALEVLTQGVDSSESLLEHLPSSSATIYDGPEANRMKVRPKKGVRLPDRKITDMLQAIRTGRVG
jgi:hypothetical protein